MRINRLDTTSAPVRTLFWAAAAFLAPLAGPALHAQAPDAPAQVAPGPGPGPAGPQGLPGGPQGAPKPEEPPTDAERFIDLAIKKIAQVKAVSADLLQEVKMLNQDFRIQGRYLRAPGTRLRMDLTVSNLADTKARFLQVCDGEILWEFQQFFDTKVCNKKNIKLILEKLSAPELDAETRERATVQLGLAGPEALLMGLRKSIKFTHMEDGTLDGKPMVIIEGSWRDRTGLVGPDQQQVAMIGQLPPYIPSHVRLYLGKEDSWPYRVNLVGKAFTPLVKPVEKGPDGRPRAARPVEDKVAPTSIIMVYSNVKFDAPASPDEFKFDPPREVPAEDITEAIVGSLDQAIKMKAAMNQSKSATSQPQKPEVPTIDQSIAVPKLPDSPAPQ